MVIAWGEVLRVYCWILVVFNYWFGSQSTASGETLEFNMLRSLLMLWVICKVLTSY